MLLKGQQLRHDLNAVISNGGKNWKIHWVWPICLKYVTGPAVALVFSFAYPKFLNKHRNDPPYVYSFVLMHMVIVFIVGCFIVPRFFNILIPAHRLKRGDGIYDVAPQMTLDNAPIVDNGGIEAGHVDTAQYSHAEGSIDGAKGGLRNDATRASPDMVEPRQ